MAKRSKNPDEGRRASVAEAQRAAVAKAGDLCAAATAKLQEAERMLKQQATRIESLEASNEHLRKQRNEEHAANAMQSRALRSVIDSLLDKLAPCSQESEWSAAYQAGDWYVSHANVSDYAMALKQDLKEQQ